MGEVLQANIFFLITGVAVIICATFLCVVLFHSIKVLKSLRRVMDRIEEGTEVIVEDIQSVRAYFTKDGFVRRFITSLFGASQKADNRGTEGKQHGKKRAELKIKDEA